MSACAEKDVDSKQDPPEFLETKADTPSDAFSDTSGNTVESTADRLGNIQYSDPYTDGLIFVTMPYEEGYAVASYEGASKNVVIPEIYKGYYVVRILEDAFKNVSKLESVTIPDSVHYIGHRAFYGCSRINEIHIPDTVTYIGQGAFSECTNLSSMIIPDGVTQLLGETFQGCTNLTDFTIPDGVTSIGNYDFAGCSGLSAITIPNTVETIGQYAFEGCSSLTTIYYKGTEKQWETVIIHSGNNVLYSATYHYE
jgi:hypothetical protein